MRATLPFAVYLREAGQVLGWSYLTNLAQTAEFQLRRRVSSSNFRESLLLRARITKMNPGSQAARYWDSFSAGGAIVEIAEDIFDERTKASYSTLWHERFTLLAIRDAQPLDKQGTAPRGCCPGGRRQPNSITSRYCVILP